MSIWIRIQGVNTKEEKLHRKVFGYIFQNDIKKSLKINEQYKLQKDPYFYSSTSVFTTLTCTFSRLFHLLDPDPGGISYADPDPKHCCGVGVIAGLS